MGDYSVAIKSALRYIFERKERAIMTIEQMYDEVAAYCEGFERCTDGCRLRKTDGGCRWDYTRDNDNSEDCYWFLIAEGLIGKPEQPEVNFVKVEQTNDVIPIDEILKLRDELFEANKIDFEGFSKINQLITQYSTYKCDIFNTDEVSECD